MDRPTDMTHKINDKIDNEKKVTKNDKFAKDDVTKEKDIEFDHLLSEAGELGLYQLFLFLKAGPFYIFMGFIYFSQLFMTEVSRNHWCRIPELENLTAVERRALAIPKDTESPVGYSQCTSYVANWTEVLMTGSVPDQSWTTEKCQHGWEFNVSEIPYPTISSELGWVCEKNSYQATAQALFFVGSIIGGFVIGWVADRFGRVPATVVANMIGCVGGIITIFARDFVEFTLSRIFMGMAYDNCGSMIYLLLLEYTVPKYRSLVANMCTAIFYTIGVVALPWIALACGDWKIISLVTCVPIAIILLSPFLLPESPRWLLTKGRVDEVVNNVKKIAKTNKKTISDDMFSRFKFSNQMTERSENVSLIQLLRRPVLRTTFICTCILYLSVMIIFDALVRTIGSLKFDFFVSFAVISFTELPSILIVSFILDITGRKFLSIVSLTICALCSFTIPFVGGGLPSVSCAVLARFFCNMAFNSISQWSAELIPTAVRGSGTSVIHICGYIAAGMSPFVAYIDNYVSWLALVIIGAISLSAAVICCFLPETAGKEMPQTFEEVEVMIRNRKLWEMPFLKRKPTEIMVDYRNHTFEMN